MSEHRAHPASHAPRRFYDGLAEGYHLLYPDWEETVLQQGEALDALVRGQLGDTTQDVLDCACGIGTQAIGLARCGHRVTGTDLSPRAAARAVREAAAAGLRLRAAAADMRALPFPADRFDAVLCADNSVAHLLTPDVLEAALSSMLRVLRPGGLLVIGLRDYTEARRARWSSTPPRTAPTANGGRAVSFQLWDWHEDGEHYDFEHFQLLPDDSPSGDGWQVRVRRTTSWAMPREQLTDAAARAGFRDLVWRDPAETGFFQPVLTGSRA